MIQTKEEQMWAIFHQLWGKDQETSTYNKRKWVELEGLILNVMKNNLDTIPKLLPINLDPDWEVQLAGDTSIENIKQIMSQRLHKKDKE